MSVSVVWLQFVEESSVARLDVVEFRFNAFKVVVIAETVDEDIAIFKNLVVYFSHLAFPFNVIFLSDFRS